VVQAATVDKGMEAVVDRRERLRVDPALLDHIRDPLLRAVIPLHLNITVAGRISSDIIRRATHPNIQVTVGAGVVVVVKVVVKVAEEVVA